MKEAGMLNAQKCGEIPKHGTRLKTYRGSGTSITTCIINGY
jgi:hypothetical protein